MKIPHVPRLFRTHASTATRRRGFTLVELLAVLAIVAILAAIILAAVSSARQEASAAKCTSNLRQIYTLVLLWSQENKGITPQGQWYKNTERAGQSVNQGGISYTTPFTGLDRITLAFCPLETPSNPESSYPSYGISGPMVPDGYWGKPGRYKLNELSPRTIFFTDTKIDTTKNNSYKSNFPTVAYRHRDKANVLYVNGLVRRETQQELGDDATRWNEGLPSD